jgi:hypothetical protein
MNYDYITKHEEADGFRWYTGINQVIDKNGTIIEELEVFSYPSVTSILDQVYPKDSYLIKWIRENGVFGQMEFIKSAEQGTTVHVAIEQLLKGEAVQTALMTPKELKCIQSFIDWHNEFNPKTIATEQIVINHNHKFAGSLDYLCELDYKDYKGQYVIDFKTSNSIYPKHKVQVAAYANSIPDNQKVAILHLGNKTKKKYSFLEYEIDEYWDQFKHFKATYDMMYPNKKSNKIDYPDYFKL